MIRRFDQMEERSDLASTARPDEAPSDPDSAPILIVDDNPANLLTYRTVLTELNEPIHTADCGETALRKLLTNDFAVILLDVNLPGMSGFETAALIRKRKRSEHTPIIFATAISVEDAHAHRGYSLGGVDYILAPVVSDVLKTKVRVFVELHRQRRAVQRQAEQLRALQEAQHRDTADQLRLALDAGRMRVWELDLGAQTITWSEIPGGVAGVNPASIWNTLGRFLDSMSPDDQATFMAELERCRADQSDLHVEPKLNLEGGGAAWVEIRARLRVGERDRFVGVCLDVTDRKSAEHTLRRALDAADEANHAKDRFLAMLSHELRTPLTPAFLAARSWESSEQIPAQLRGDLALISNSIQTEARLIDDLLDLTAITRGAMRIEKRVIDFHQVVENALRAIVRPEGAELTELHVHLESGPVLVHCDSTRLQQVVWNLVANAFKFTPNGGRVELRTLRQGERVILEVQDNGVGIEAGDRKRIFEPFERAGPRASRAGGLGLGLAITRTIVELHGGTVEADSAGANRGTTLRVTLPALITAMESPAPTATASEVTGLRILLVEDHKSTAEVLARLLKLKGHAVAAAATVESALSLVSQGEFDLLISDVGLPDGTGFDLLKRIRATHAFPAIALTGFGAAEDIRTAHASGFAAHLAKPADLDELQATINRVVREARVPVAG